MRVGAHIPASGAEKQIETLKPFRVRRRMNFSPTPTTICQKNMSTNNMSGNGAGFHGLRFLIGFNACVNRKRSVDGLDAIVMRPGGNFEIQSNTTRRYF